jgi:hypothetical protein
LLASATNDTLTHGSSTGTSPLNFNQPAYDIVIEASIAAGSTQSWFEITLAWVDSNTLFDIATETYLMAVTSNGVNIIAGRGQTKGDILELEFKNLDTAETITYSYTVVAHSRVPLFTDWRQTAFNGISAPALLTAPSDADSNILCSISVSVAEASNTSYILPLFTGKVTWVLNAVAATGARMAVRVPAEPLSGSGSITTNNTIIDSGIIAVGNAFVATDVAMPKQNCQLELLNTDATAAQTIGVAAIMSET